ncbi:MAG: transposase [Polyangiaceae bacterium]|nr:transposase [Polyangiaceae bacterium]
MPLYRQCKEFARMGVPLSTSTIGDWSAFALDVLAPVAGRVAEKVIASPVHQCGRHGFAGARKETIQMA